MFTADFRYLLMVFQSWELLPWISGMTVSSVEVGTPTHQHSHLGNLPDFLSWANCLRCTNWVINHCSCVVVKTLINQYIRVRLRVRVDSLTAV